MSESQWEDDCRSHSKCMAARRWCVSGMIQTFLDFWLTVRQQCWQGTNCLIQRLDCKLSTKVRKEKFTFVELVKDLICLSCLIHNLWGVYSVAALQSEEAYSQGGNVQHHKVDHLDVISEYHTDNKILSFLLILSKKLPKKKTKNLNTNPSECLKVC